MTRRPAPAVPRSRNDNFIAQVMSYFDEAFGAIAQDAGSDVRADYAGAREDRYTPALRGVDRSGSNADYHFRDESSFYVIMERARELARNDMIVRQGLRRVVNNVLRGDGIVPDPDTGDDDLNARITDAWWAWADDPAACDAAGENTIESMARLALQQMLEDGDHLWVGTTEGRIAAYEAHRLRTPEQAPRRGAAASGQARGPGGRFASAAPKIILGVEMDAFHRRLAYHVTKSDVDPFGDVQRNRDIVRIAAAEEAPPAGPLGKNGGGRAAFHLYDPSRSSQTRGVSVLQPVFLPASLHGRLQVAKMVQAVVASCVAFIRNLAPGSISPPGELPTGEKTITTTRDGRRISEQELGFGMQIYGEPGETWTGFSPNIPNAEFFDHASLILTIVAVNLGIPLQVLLLDPTKSNFSSWRGSMDEARKGFEALQKVMIERLYAPLWRWRIRRWAAGREADAKLSQKLLDAQNPFGNRWRTPTWPYIEPLKDSQADTSRVEGNLISFRRVHAEAGRDWSEVSREIVEDKARLAELAMEAAQKLNDRFPWARLDWRELCGMVPKHALPDAGANGEQSDAKPAA